MPASRSSSARSPLRTTRRQQQLRIHRFAWPDDPPGRNVLPGQIRHAQSALTWSVAKRRCRPQPAGNTTADCGFWAELNLVWWRWPRSCRGRADRRRGPPQATALRSPRPAWHCGGARVHTQTCAAHSPLRKTTAEQRHTAAISSAAPIWTRQGRTMFAPCSTPTRWGCRTSNNAIDLALGWLLVEADAISDALLQPAFCQEERPTRAVADQRYLWRRRVAPV